ncbi:hypothetical protein SPRG_00504 [Saprolegnia parasitica CBS 223.65]|uniref:Uncharacterized protein n=1 Tax=Saprolegnia parasitica (strain CBS 223.65) TaxID=695850 RepID=A0A067CZ45_SAPPC|nr:hypothetical protein SPRG_00504 [Saprolegnia parasitica CBS 223.65]KDO35743.1 hypothetical protein SPRG_00504 [Saprolegnia parasitica CBS 223.65]|eukprot:XP_012193988.1 hypothetical protein SPRG_00504 [Saprolegnia parasitica CBS 223.65]
MSSTKAMALASTSIWWKVGAVSGATAVLLGAFGAHGLKSRVSDPKLLKTWDTGAHYHLVHSLALLAVPFSRRPNLAGGLISTGIVFFSGSLYAIVLTDHKSLGMITPMGGLMFVAGWLSLLL